jgi:hypothetical protein
LHRGGGGGGGEREGEKVSECVRIFRDNLLGPEVGTAGADALAHLTCLTKLEARCC